MSFILYCLLLQTKMSRRCRFLLFLKHMCLVTLIFAGSFTFSFERYCLEKSKNPALMGSENLDDEFCSRNFSKVDHRTSLKQRHHYYSNVLTKSDFELQANITLSPHKIMVLRGRPGYNCSLTRTINAGMKQVSLINNRSPGS